MRYATIHTLRSTHPVGALCRALGVPASSYHAWCARAARRAATGAAARDAALVAALTTAHRVSRRTYGRPRLTRDTTWIPTREGALALAAIVDVGSRRAVGWATSPTLDSALTRRALEIALARRSISARLLHHADLGSEYVAGRYCEALADAKITLSFSRPGNCWDNAVAESFFATLKDECVPETPGGFATHASALTHLFEYIDVFSNHQRRHSTLDFMSPADYEAQHEAHDSA
jgi:putative transposase